VCTQSGCGTVTASAWTGSPVWAVVLVVALAVAGAWLLPLPTRGGVPLGVAALTGLAGAVSAGIVVASLDALVFNHAGFYGFDLPVTETFPVLAVHPGPGLLLGLVGLLLQTAGGWTSIRLRTATAAGQPWAKGTAAGRGADVGASPARRGEAAGRAAVAFRQGAPRRHRRRP